MTNILRTCSVAALLAAPAAAEQAFPDSVVQTLAQASSHLGAFADVWPGTNADTASMSDVVIRLQSGGRAWSIDGGCATSLVPPLFPAADGTQINFALSRTDDGRPSIDLLFEGFGPMTSDAAPDPAKIATVLTLHEAFHEYVQRREGWLDADADQDSRATFLPADPAPRILRAQLAGLLRQAFLEPGRRAELLPQAKFLLEAYKTGYADETRRIRMTDVKEGTAEFTAVLFAARALSDWSTDPDKIRAQIPGLVQPGGDRPAAADLESYAIGLYAGLLLNETTTPGWRQEARRVPLAEILLSDVAPAASAPEVAEDDGSDIRAALAMVDDAYLPRAQDLVSAWQGTDEFVGLNRAIFAEGEAQTFEMFATTATTPVEMELGLGFGARVEMAQWQGLVAGDVLLSLNRTTACGGDTVVLMRATDLPEALLATAERPESPRADGNNLLCVGE